jgi:hypothetical protein
MRYIAHIHHLGEGYEDVKYYLALDKRKFKYLYEKN